MAIRSPLCVILAHVDHGKTSILDKIRGTAIAMGEAGGITQAIGASIIPLHTIQKVCGPLLDALGINFTIPGLLFIDTPGHASFTSLRKRGGNVADIAILVVDVNEGLKPQTLESIEILKKYKTPFVIAANKIDLISGWKSQVGKGLLSTIREQDEKVNGLLETRMYDLVGKLSELGFAAERFDRVDDFTKSVALVPTSALTGDGIPELLMVISGVAQKFLEAKLEVNVAGDARGTILEVKEQKGLGVCIDVILFDGSLRKGDTLVIGTVGEALVTNVKGLFVPQAMAEMRDAKSKFKPIEAVSAATGVRIGAPNLDTVMAGMPVRSCSPGNTARVSEEIRQEVEEVLISTDKEGVVIKADTIGSLEALELTLREKQVTIKKASVGDITKRDVLDAEANLESDPFEAVVLGFNVEDAAGYKKEGVKVITSRVIYKLVDDFVAWQEGAKKSAEEGRLKDLVRPCKIQVLKGYIFRQNNPAVVGIDILSGTLQNGTPLMNDDGIKLSEVKSMQADQDNVEKAEQGKQVAVSLPGVTVGRQIDEGKILYSAIPEQDFKTLKTLTTYLSSAEKATLKEIAAIKRKDNPVWGV